MFKRSIPFEKRLLNHWYSTGQSLRALEKIGLWGLTGVYRALLLLRTYWHRWVSPPATAPGVRVISIGNLVAGGAGKTPCTLALVRTLGEAGRRCAIITRGYRSKASEVACVIASRADLPMQSALAIGDEAWLLAWHSGVPVASGKNRHQCLQALLARYPRLDTIVLDDGLQQRDIASDTTVLLVDDRGFGNGHCLPYGPLREPVGDLQRFSGLVCHGSALPTSQVRPVPRLRGMLTYDDVHWVNLRDWHDALHRGLPLARRAPVQTEKCLAVAGIAVPERFFRELIGMGFGITPLGLSDHDPQTVVKTMAAWHGGVYSTILMTEKDAVKFLHQDHPLLAQAWALVRRPVLSPSFTNEICDGPKTS